jgi:hypothetical protein
LAVSEGHSDESLINREIHVRFFKSIRVRVLLAFE